MKGTGEKEQGKKGKEWGDSREVGEAQRGEKRMGRGGKQK